MEQENTTKENEEILGEAVDFWARLVIALADIDKKLKNEGYGK